MAPASWRLKVGLPERAQHFHHLLPPSLDASVRFGLLQASSRAVIRSNSNSDSTGLTINPADPTDPADPANPTDSTDSAAVAVSISKLIPDLVDDLPSLALLTGAVLYSLDLGSSAHLLLVYLSCFLVSFFLDETVLAFLTSCSFLYLACLAVPRILYRPVKKQEKLQILI